MSRYKLGDICQIVSGSTPKTGIAEYWDGNIKWITPAELNDDSYIITDSVRKITELAVSKTGLNSFPEGTVILSSRAPIGKVAIAGCEMYCNQGFKNLICTDKINSKYLYWFLKGKTDYLNSLGRGATFKELSKGIVAGIEIDVPTMHEQKDIVEQFEKISSIISMQKEQLENLDKLIKSRFVEMFGDPILNPKGFAESTVNEYCKMTQGTQIPMSEQISEYQQGYYRYLYIRDLKYDDSNWIYVQDKYDDKKLTEKDLVVVNTGNTAGEIYYGKDGILSNNLFKVSFDTNILNTTYMFAYFSSPEFQSMLWSEMKEGTQPHLGHKIFGSKKLIIPPIDLQNQFAAFVEQTDKSKVVVQKALDETQILLDSLMQEYFDFA